MGMLYYDPKYESVGACRGWTSYAPDTEKKINIGSRWQKRHLTA